MSLDFTQLRELLAAIAHTDIAELILKSSDFELTVRKESRSLPQSDLAFTTTSSPVPTGLVPPPLPRQDGVPIAPPPPVEPIATEAPLASPPPPNPKWEEIASPMVGTFYRAPGPEEPAFVEVGDRIRKGQTVCIIEAMKLMNEIEAEISGQVMEILVKNGEPVEYGQLLMRVNPES
ncbi:MAG TPA: acetyl-CoA carboxylase biotin carboxyl carrier protein [Coleofasciculaceae cyanobacterium]